MALFINGHVEPKLHKMTDGLPNVLNQNSYRVNYLEKMMKQQQDSNSRLAASFQKVNSTMNESKSEQSQFFEKLLTRIEVQEEVTNKLYENIKLMEQTNGIVLERLEKLEKMNYGLENKIEQDGLIHQAVLDQLSFQDDSTVKLANKLEALDTSCKELAGSIKHQEHLKEQIAGKLAIQDIYHQTVMERLDQQEAISHKISRQLENLKSILFERTALLIEKVEANYKLTTGYLFGMVNKTGIVHRISVNKKDREKEGTQEQEKQRLP